MSTPASPVTAPGGGRAGPTRAPGISVERLTKRYGRVLAVDGLSFEVPPGQVTGLLGPNGAGKTTTLRMVVGLVTPTSGRATVGGRPFRELPDPGRRLGAVLETTFHPSTRARGHLRELALASGTPASRVDEVLAQVDLTGAARRRVGGFSLGMRQRLALAGALLGDPEVLILDEPANGLDPEGVRWLRLLLRGFAAEGRTVLVSSHVLAEVAQTVDRVVIMARGRLVTEAPVGELTTRLSPGVRVRTPQPDRLRAALADEGLELHAAGDGLLSVPGARAEVVGELAAAAGVALHELAPEQSRLEDVFLELTRDGDGP